MTEQDKADFTIAIRALCETLGREASKATLYGYWVALSDLPLEAVQHAIARALRSCKFMPAPVELREFAGEASSDDRAQAAWLAVERAVPIGSYRTVDFADPVINATIRSLGGWPEILDKSEREFDTFVRKDFLKAYAAFAKAGVDGDACKPLPGLADVAVCGITRIGSDGKQEGLCHVGSVQGVSPQRLLEVKTA